MESDVLVCGSDAEAKAVVGGLIEAIPNLRWVDAGDLTQARTRTAHGPVDLGQPLVQDPRRRVPDHRTRFVGSPS